MNKLTKIGVSALCGSLAAVASANAGSMAVTGGATATYTQNSGDVTGNPLGMASAMTFTGTGELDNGTAVTLSLAHNDKNTWSSGSIAADIPGIGTITFDQGGGTGLDRIDDMMPTAWEETTGTGLNTGIRTVSGAGGSQDIEWAVSPDLTPDGLSVHIAYNPLPGGTQASDKGGQGATGNGGITGAGWDVVVQHSGLYDGLNVFAGYSEIEQVGNDRTGYAYGATYAVGGFTLGYERQRDSNPAINNKTRYYENDLYGVSFAVNDDLTISYGNQQSTRHTAGNDADIEAEASSLQLSYSMGGASIKVAESSVDNKSYTTGTANQKDGTTVAVTLAF